MFTRRKFLKSTAISTLSLSAATLLPNMASFADNPQIHKNRLKIPPLNEGKIENNVRIFNLEMQNGITEFYQGIKTPTSGINGSYLAPTLKMINGEQVRLNVKNSIGETTTLHWHGFHLPAKYDGGPHQPIKNGEIWSPQFTIMQKAASFWYHPHLMGKTAEHVWHGLAGMIIVEDKESMALSLPNEYGVDDVPIVLQDRRFLSNGAITYTPTRHDIMMGMVGDVPLTNGTIEPYFVAKRQYLRLRILNGANASIYQLSFSDKRKFWQIATDGSMLEEPLETDEILLSPGERAQIVVDVSGNKNFMLQSKPYLASMMGGGGMMGSGMGGSMMGGSGNSDEYGVQFNFLEIIPAENLAKSPPLPKKLTKIDWLDSKEADKERKFLMSMKMGPAMMLGMGNTHTINGKSMDMKRIDEVIKLNSTEIWEISNDSMLPHPFHIHDVQFQILSRNGQKPSPSERGLKDTVLVHPGEKVRFIAKFKDYADDKYPYMYHCHILEHEDAGMMGQFLVVDS